MTLVSSTALEITPPNMAIQFTKDRVADLCSGSAEPGSVVYCLLSELICSGVSCNCLCLCSSLVFQMPLATA